MEETIAILIPIVGIVMGVSLAMISVITAHRRRAQALDQRHRERMAAIEKGIDLPMDAGDPEAELERLKAARQPRFLLRGLVLTGIGLALILAWSGPGGQLSNSAGWIVLAIGVAQLLYYAIEGRKLSAPRIGDQRPVDK
jgi:hypothetical protein